MSSKESEFALTWVKTFCKTIHWTTVNVKQWVIDYRSKNIPELCEFVKCIFSFSFSPGYSLILLRNTVHMLVDGNFDYTGSYNMQLIFVAM